MRESGLRGRRLEGGAVGRPSPRVGFDTDVESKVSPVNTTPEGGGPSGGESGETRDVGDLVGGGS